MTDFDDKPDTLKSPAAALSEAILAKLHEHRISVEELADRTRVSADTLSLLAGKRNWNSMPAVYIRGHLLLVCRELELDEAEMTALFDAAYGNLEKEAGVPVAGTMSLKTLAITTGLATMGILAIVMAFWSV